MQVKEDLQTRRNLNRSLKKDKVETQNYSDVMVQKVYPYLMLCHLALLFYVV